MPRLILTVLLLATVAASAADWTIAIRVRGTVEVSPDGQTWEALVRNRLLNDQGFTRTLADSLGQVRWAAGSLAILGPLTTVRLEPEALRLEEGGIRLHGQGKLATRLGTIQTQDDDTDCCLIDQGQSGLMCHVFEGWVRIERPSLASVDVDEGERAVWNDSALSVKPAEPTDIPVDLRPPPED